MSRVLVRQSSDNLRRSYLRDAVGTPARGMFDDSAPASSMLYRGQYDPSLEINYVDDPRLAVGETFTRATIGTTVDFEGRVLTAKSGEARFYGMRRVENRLRFTEDFTNALWTKTGASVAARAPASGAPLKDRMSDKLVEDTSAGNHQINQSVAYVLGATYCVYVDVAPGERTWCELLFPSSAFGSARGSYFDLVNGVVGSAVTGITARGIFPVGDGFLRCWILHTASASASGTPTLRIATADLTDNYTGDGRSGVYLRRAQDQDVSGQSWQGPSEYVSVDMLPAPYHGANVDGVRYHTTTYQGAKIPRYTATAPAVGRCGLLRERASKNVVLQSENFGTTWAATGTPTRVAAAKMCGSVVLDLIGDDDAAVVEGYSQGLTFTGDAVKALSIFFAQGTAASSVFQLFDTTGAAAKMTAAITWAAGVPTVTMTVGTLLGVDTLANGVYRMRVLSTAVTAANANNLRVFPATLAAGTVVDVGTIYMGGVQAEDLDHATSYIPTTTVAVTRNQDINTGPSYAGAWMNQTEGSWYCEVVPQSVGSLDARIVGNGNSSGPLILTTVNKGAAFDGTSGTITANLWTAGALTRLASRYKVGLGKSVSLNNGAIVTDANAAYTWTTFQIGQGVSGGELDGCIGRIWHIPRDIGDRIKDLTT